MFKETDYITDNAFLLDDRLTIEYKAYRKKHPEDSELSMYMYAFLEGMRYVQRYVNLIVGNCIVRDEQILEKDNGRE